MEEKENVLAAVSANELAAMSAILHFYERYLWNSLAPSRKRSRQGVEITALIVKLCLLPTGKGVVVTDEEIVYIEAALAVFISQVENKVPSSDNREGILTSCNQLRGVVAALLLPEQMT